MFLELTTAVSSSPRLILPLCGHRLAPVCAHSGRSLRSRVRASRFVASCSQTFQFSTGRNMLAYHHTYEEASGPSETEGRCLIRGASSRSLSARSVGLLGSPFLSIIFTLCPLIIDPVGPTVPAEPSGHRLVTSTCMQCDTGTLRNEVNVVSVQKDQERSVLVDHFHSDSVKRLLKLCLLAQLQETWFRVMASLIPKKTTSE